MLIRPGQASESVLCTGCPEQVGLLSLESAASLFGIPSRQIYRWVESGALHFQESASGHLLVCPASLQKAVQLSAGKLLTNSKDEDEEKAPND